MSRDAFADVCLVIRWFVLEMLLPLVGLTAFGCLLMIFCLVIAQGIEALFQ